MAFLRLDYEERRRGIVEAAVPLFARKGFAGTTSKEIAEAARVSEALVYKHFPSKAALYEEIVRQGCLGDPGLACIAGLEASTVTLIGMVHYMLRHFVCGATPGSATAGEVGTRMRLILNSYLDDGEYGRLAFEWVVGHVYPKIAECLDAAEASGDVVAVPIARENRFWFGQHVAAMLAYVRLSGRSLIPYAGDTDQVIRQAAWFILRGFGVKDEIIAVHEAAAFEAARARDEHRSPGADVPSVDVPGVDVPGVDVPGVRVKTMPAEATEVSLG